MAVADIAVAFVPTLRRLRGETMWAMTPTVLAQLEAFSCFVARRAPAPVGDQELGARTKLQRDEFVGIERDFGVPIVKQMLFASKHQPLATVLG